MATEQDLMRLKEEFSPWLLDQHENPGVWTVGIEADDQGQPVLVIGIDSEHPETKEKIRGRMQGYPVKFRQQEQVRPLLARNPKP
jgi:hypothetical protein